jgi:hypothetical protein
MAKNPDKYRYVEIAIPRGSDLLRHLEQLEEETSVPPAHTLVLLANEMLKLKSGGTIAVTSQTVAMNHHHEPAGLSGASDDDLLDIDPD